MQILTITDKDFGENCYHITDDKNSYIIDPGIDTEKIIAAINKCTVPLKYVFLTHGHYDHAFSYKIFDPNIIYAHADEKVLLEDASKNLSQYTVDAFSIKDINYFSESKYTIDNIEIYHTPGHTAGGVVIKIGSNLFSGDTLFYDTVGRTDLPTGNSKTLQNSIKLFDSFDKTLMVYPGHGKPFLLGDAYKVNYFLKDNR